MDYRTAAKEINKGNILPVYICYGSETYRMEEFISFLTDKWIDPVDRDFAVSKFDLAETNVEAVIDDAETLPFMGARKLIIAKDAVFFTAAKEHARVEHKLDRLLDYLKSPAPYSVIVFMIAADKLDERKKLVKTMIERKGTVPFLPMNADDLLQWVRRQAEKLHFTFAEGAEQMLILNCGGHLQTLAGEMQKLSLHIGINGVITPHIVESMVTRSTERNVFLMIDELVRLRLDKALELLHELLKHKEEPVKILALMARQFRNMLMIKQLTMKGSSQQQMASQLGLHPYAVKIAAEQARRYETDKLKQALCHLADTDYRMKTGQIDKVLALEMFMLRTGKDKELDVIDPTITID